MKRLKNKILSMEPNTTTYKAMYEGSMTIVDPASTMPAYVDYSSTYYNESIGFDISTTHKLAQDKPTVVISIPCATLGIDIPDKSTESVEADFCLRAFKKYIDEHPTECAGCGVMIAFSGEVTLEDYPSDKPFTEASRISTFSPPVGSVYQPSNT